MAKAEKPKNKPQMTDKAQSERFRKTAREIECDESEEAFVKTFKKIVSSKPIKQKASLVHPSRKPVSS
jgi:hypothetical protein